MKRHSMSHEIPTHGVMIHRRTGLPVGPMARLNPDDYPFAAMDRSEVLWRYMDSGKFKDMLEKSALYFARPDRFKDPFEGRFSRGNEAGCSDSDKAFYSAYMIEGSTGDLAAALETHRQCVFISCWHRNYRESRKMWNAYTTSAESVAVTTSAGAIEDFFPDEILKSPVRYHEEDFKRSLLFGWNGIFFYNPSTYAFEREFRMLRSLGEDESVQFENPADYGRRVKFNLNRIIHRVVTHPRATETFKNEVDALMRIHLRRISRQNSALLP